MSPFNREPSESYLTGFTYHNNNGHGNNTDGVDLSNPGSAPFAAYDPSGDVDDEAKTMIQTGPKEIIYLFELDSTEHTNSSFDLQDMAVVVTLNEVSK